MGLNERRKVKELQDVTFPGRAQEMQEICGSAIPYEVDLPSIQDDAEALNFIDNISCHRLNMALRVICQDEMGKSAVRDCLKQVKLKNVKDESRRRLAFEKGILEMQVAYALGARGMYSDGEIRQVLEKNI